MTRDDFLNAIWKPYPQASADWLDVASYLTEQKKLYASSDSVGCSFAEVAGRLVTPKDFNPRTIKCEKWILSSGGKEVEFEILPETKWLEIGEDINVERGILKAGDLVCLRIKSLSGEGRRQVDGLSLLVPSRGEFGRSLKFTSEASVLWTEFTQVLRKFFVDRGFIEGRTPTLVPSPGSEPYLDFFETTWEYGRLRRRFFLPTSPEFHLKKLLVLGWTKVFEIRSCFRNGEISSHHQPEFLMLEWYRAYSNLDAIADDVVDLLRELESHFLAKDSKNSQLKHKQKNFSKVQRVSMAELFQREFDGFVLRPDTTIEELVSLARKYDVGGANDESWDDLFMRLFVDKIEFKLGTEGPLIVHGYPPSQAALARIREDGFADRFEFYWRGLEIANAFHELNDPNENERRFLADLEQKKNLGKAVVPIDHEFISAMSYGMPPSGGIALGVDRLFMALFEFQDIEETRPFVVKLEE